MKHKYQIGEGDLIFNNLTKDICVVTKTTQRYYYYAFLDSLQTARSSLEKTWENIDMGLLGVSYHNMKKKKKQTKIRTLDLHGVKHHKVEEQVRKFLNFVELPCTIVTGHSTKMKKIVLSVVSEYDWDCKEKIDNPGALIVLEK